MSYPPPRLSTVVEPLEDRRLFSIPANVPWQSGIAVLPGSSGLPGIPAAPIDASAAAGVVQIGGTLDSVPGTPINVKTTDLTGVWKGKVRGTVALFFSKSYKATLSITSQTDTALTGVLTVKGHKFDGTFTGSINPDGTFHYEYASGDVTLKLDGQITYRGDYISGTIDAKYDGWSIGGTFKFHRKLTPAQAAAAKAAKVK